MILNLNEYNNIYDKDIVKLEYLNSNGYDIKYALRTLNLILKQNDKKKIKDILYKDIKSGQWSLDIVPIEELNLFIQDNNIKEINSKLIDFCIDWINL